MEANGATEVAIEEGGGSEEREGGSVEVEVDGELEGPVQVSVFPQGIIRDCTNYCDN